MLTNEEFEQLHTEPEENAEAAPTREIWEGDIETENSAAFGAEIFALLDAILGVNTDVR